MLEQRCVVDHAADLAEFMCAFGQQAAHTGLDGEVTVDRDGPSSERLDLAHGIERFVARRGVVHRDVPAVAGERERDLATNAARRTRDERSAVRFRPAASHHGSSGTAQV